MNCTFILLRFLSPRLFPFLHGFLFCKLSSCHSCFLGYFTLPPWRTLPGNDCLVAMAMLSWAEVQGGCGVCGAASFHLSGQIQRKKAWGLNIRLNEKKENALQICSGHIRWSAKVCTAPPPPLRMSIYKANLHFHFSNAPSSSPLAPTKPKWSDIMKAPLSAKITRPKERDKDHKVDMEGEENLPKTNGNFQPQRSTPPKKRVLLHNIDFKQYNSMSSTYSMKLLQPIRMLKKVSKFSPIWCWNHNQTQRTSYSDT